MCDYSLESVKSEKARQGASYKLDTFSGNPTYSVVYDDGGTAGARDKLGRITEKTETIGGTTDRSHSS